MAALFKPIPTELDKGSLHLQESTGSYSLIHDEERLNSSSTTASTPMLSAATPTPTTYFYGTSSIHDIFVGSSFSTVGDNAVDHQNNTTPSDGEVVWYCSDCGDGPLGSWYSACPMCNHKRCGGCTVQST